MSAAPNQLAEINLQLREQFSSHSAISLQPMKGDPPEQYHITYSIRGLCKNEQNEIVETSRHIIELTIPFGFPHFPPTCTPKSDSFHPDFDPAAICLGDFWNQNRQLDELIVHIGRMINGEVYSRSNAFNEEACSWYLNHQDTFPLSEIIWRESPPDLDISEEKNKQYIDTLDDSDLSTDFNFLALEDIQDQDDPLAEGSSSSDERTSSVDPGYLQLLESQNKIFKLRDSLKDAGKLSDEMQQQFEKIDKAIKKAEDLSRQARRNEKQGDFRSSLISYEQIAAIAADFPNIEDHLRRIRQILSPAEKDADNDPPDGGVFSLDQELMSEDTSAEPEKDLPLTGKRQPQAAKKRERGEKSRPLGRLLVCLLLTMAAVLLAGCGYYYWSAKKQLERASVASRQCSELMEKELFQEAKQSCDNAMTAVQKVKFIDRQKVGLLRHRISEILHSERLIQGISGKILVNGEYLLKKDAETIQMFRKLHDDAKSFFLQENWHQALDHFAKIIAEAETADPVPAGLVEEAKNKHGICRFKIAYAAVEEKLIDNKWQEAISQIVQAERFLGSLPVVDRQNFTNKLHQARTKSNFEHHRQQGNVFFAESDWQKAIASYTLALSTDGVPENLAEESFEAVQQSMKRAELYQLIDQGNKTSGSGFWDEAISNYSKAETFLVTHQALLRTIDAEITLKKLSRIILQVLIIRDRQLAKSYLEKNEMKAAGDVYRQLIEKIDHSSFAGEREFLDNKEEFDAAIRSLDEKIYLADKTKYLQDNYRALFVSNYPHVIKEALENPIVTLSKDTGDKMVFKMQCTESGSGRPLTLVMHYTFEKKSGRWHLYSE